MRRELLLLEEMIDAAEQAHVLAVDQTPESLAAWSTTTPPTEKIRVIRRLANHASAEPNVLVGFGEDTWKPPTAKVPALARKMYAAG